eukprot:gene30487-40510_t
MAAAKFIRGGVIVGGLVGGIICTYYSVAHVPRGHRGIVFSKLSGVLVGDNFKLNEGFNFIIPWLHSAIVFDIRTREKILDLHFGSKDLRTVSMTFKVFFRPDQNELSFLFCNMGTNYDERVIPSLVNEVAKSVVAKYNATELMANRQLVNERIRDVLTQRLAKYKIIIDDVVITQLAFSE